MKEQISLGVKYHCLKKKQAPRAEAQKSEASPSVLWIHFFKAVKNTLKINLPSCEDRKKVNRPSTTICRASSALGFLEPHSPASSLFFTTCQVGVDYSLFP